MLPRNDIYLSQGLWWMGARMFVFLQNTVISISFGLHVVHRYVLLSLLTTSENKKGKCLANDVYTRGCCFCLTIGMVIRRATWSPHHHLPLSSTGCCHVCLTGQSVAFQDHIFCISIFFIPVFEKFNPVCGSKGWTLHYSPSSERPSCMHLLLCSIFDSTAAVSARIRGSYVGGTSSILQRFPRREREIRQPKIQVYIMDFEVVGDTRRICGSFSWLLRLNLTNFNLWIHFFPEKLVWLSIQSSLCFHTEHGHLLSSPSSHPTLKAITVRLARLAISDALKLPAVNYALCRCQPGKPLTTRAAHLRGSCRSRPFSTLAFILGTLCASTKDPRCVPRRHPSNASPWCGVVRRNTWKVYVLGGLIV